MVEYDQGDQIGTMLTKKNPESYSIIIYSTPRLDMALIIEGIIMKHHVKCPNITFNVFSICYSTLTSNATVYF